MTMTRGCKCRSVSQGLKLIVEMVNTMVIQVWLDRFIITLNAYTLTKLCMVLCMLTLQKLEK
ncbi:hypothetical protein BCR43DRAFT_491894 [Syncephalastrum racemosum]|uniref:Uncharacterized protein n=1 Tax=Syncephalastrum racemosum TaxID=13706 RepID=A0A1X2HCN4_SYNRA|nr:hypothetical protein BCR43DRAFT_491894 [Syncephalastrum racemosum]